MNPTLPLLKRIAQSIRTPRLRTLREFAEQEIVIPTGPYAGLRFNCARQPFTRLWFDAVDSGRWRRTATTGPSQTGKTFLAFVIPSLYHLFEVGETIIIGLPSLDIAGDKWTEDLLPAIQASGYRHLLPTSGPGSRGGKSNMSSVRFNHGVTLRFMTGGGDDKSRSAFTSRVLLTTETDGLDLVSEGSREADKVAQLEARTQAFGDRARIYHECTVSLEEGRIWQEITNGTDSRIAIRCAHCRQYVTPEREHLIGWREAVDELDAGEKGRLVCPGCGVSWTEEERIAANHDCLLVHRGQEITPDGAITATAPRTETLGFRWNAANNLLVKTSAIAKKEWKAARAADEDNADKELNQFWWAKPYKPSATSLTAVDPYVIIKRVTSEPRGRVPSDVSRLTLGVDVGKYLAHWTLFGWRQHATPHVIEYGRIEVPTAEMGEERAILAALRQFRDEIAVGWPAEGGTRHPELRAVDAGNWQDVILQFCAESPGWQACKGFGESQRRGRRYLGEKTEAGWKVVWAPPDAGYELLQHPTQTATLLLANSDRWKSWLHARLLTPMGQPGAFTLYGPGDHLTFAKHLTAEKKIEEFVAGEGLSTRWEQVNRNNHFLDSSCLAGVMGHVLGERLIGELLIPDEQKPSPRDNETVNPLTAHRGRW